MSSDEKHLVYCDKKKPVLEVMLHTPMSINNNTTYFIHITIHNKMNFQNFQKLRINILYAHPSHPRNKREINKTKRPPLIVLFVSD